MERKIYRLDEPQTNSKLIDVASGTGDIAKLFFEKTNFTAQITCIEPNKEMLDQGKIKLKKINRLSG